MPVHTITHSVNALCAEHHACAIQFSSQICPNNLVYDATDHEHLDCVCTICIDLLQQYIGFGIIGF